MEIEYVIEIHKVNKKYFEYSDMDPTTDPHDQ